MKLFYSDVDDTIIDKRGMTEEIKKMTNLIFENKDFFIPCSGRPTQSLVNTFKNLKIKYAIGYNGSEIIDITKNKILYKEHLKKDDVLKIIKYLQEIDCEFLLYGNKIFASDIKNQYALKEQELCQMEMLQLNFQNVGSTPKVLGLTNPEDNQKNVELLKEKFPEFEIALSKPFFIEITQKNVSKGNAIKKLNELLNADEKNCYCFGDGNNDLSMFDLNINKIAVENAVDELKQKADLIIQSCEENGVPKYVEKILKEKNE